MDVKVNGLPTEGQVSYNGRVTGGRIALVAATLATCSRMGYREPTSLSFIPPTPELDAAVQRDITVAGRCRVGALLSITGDLEAPVETRCNRGSFLESVALSGGDGAKRIGVEQLSVDGEIERIERTVTLDTTPPSLSFCCGTPAENATVPTRNLDLSGLCEPGLAVSITGDVETPMATPCSAGAFSAAPRLTPNDAVKTIAVSQVDAAGNIGSATLHVSMELAAAVLELSGPSSVAVGDCARYRVTATDPDGVPTAVTADTGVELGGEGSGSFYADASCSVGPSAGVLIPATADTADFYFAGPIGETLSITAAATGFAPDSLSVRVNPIAGFEGAGGGTGSLIYTDRGATFNFTLDANGLTGGTDYTLIYFPDHSGSPQSGAELICLATGTSDNDGGLRFDDGAGGPMAFETDTDLPSGADDRFYTRTGARLLLVLASDVDCAVAHMTAWNPDEYLLDTEPVQFNDTEVTHLVAKTGTWDPIPNSYYGEVHFAPVGVAFDYRAWFRALAPNTDYTLIYYHDPWPGIYSHCLGGGTSDGSGSLLLANTVELDGGLPATTDPNYGYAKVWLLPTTLVDCAAPRVTSFDVAATVFDYGDGMIFTDSEHPRTNILGLHGSATDGVACKPSSTAFQSVPMPSQPGSFRLTLTAKPSSTTGLAITGLSSGRASDLADLAVAIAFDTDGCIRAFDGGTGSWEAVTDIPYTVGAKGIYRLRIDVDVLAHSYDAAVLSGEDGHDWQVLGQDFAFPNAQTTSLDAVVLTTPTGDSHLVCGAAVE